MENSRILLLHQNSVRSGAIPQEAFNWSRSKKNWKRDLFAHSDFISRLPTALDRATLRELATSSANSNVEKFIAIMIWGYGDVGYGSYRVNIMLNSIGFSEKIDQVSEYCRNGQPLKAYGYLTNNRIEKLGPEFGTKFISFLTPREIVAPIYDSFISKWMALHAQEAFAGKSSSSLAWNLRTYSAYVQWMEKQAAKLDCLGDDLELLIFRDALQQFSNSSRWANL